jgi:hypothetical protein
MNKMTKCDRCDAEYKEYCDGGSFVEYEYEKDIGIKDFKFKVVVRGLYDGKNPRNSRMELIYNGVRLGNARPYNMEFFNNYCKMLEKDNFEIKVMRCEDYIYRVCKCDKSIVGEPLGEPLK